MMLSSLVRAVGDAGLEKSGRNGQNGRPVEVPCGTPGSTAPYKRHRRRGEEPCAACRAEYNRWHRERYAVKRGGS